MEEQKKKKSNRSRLFAITYILIIILFIFSFVTRIRVKEGKPYHKKNEVALYLFTYKILPSNYHQKSNYNNSKIQPENGEYIGGDQFDYRGEIEHYT